MTEREIEPEYSRAVERGSALRLAARRAYGQAVLYTALDPDDAERRLRQALATAVSALNWLEDSDFERVFGADSREYDLLFSKVDGRSLTDLRAQLAHGLVSELSAADARTIRERVSEVRLTSRDLILRLLLGLSADEPLPGSTRGVSASFSDPRNIEIATSLAGLPDQDWAIQPEWVSWL